jgi:hypothetical protein
MPAVHGHGLFARLLLVPLCAFDGTGDAMHCQVKFNEEAVKKAGQEALKQLE